MIFGKKMVFDDSSLHVQYLLRGTSVPLRRYSSTSSEVLKGQRAGLQTGDSAQA